MCDYAKITRACTHSLTHARLTAIFLVLPGVSQYQKGKTNLDFTEARDSEWQWHQLGHMQWCFGGYTSYTNLWGFFDSVYSPQRS